MHLKTTLPIIRQIDLFLLQEYIVKLVCTANFFIPPSSIRLHCVLMEFHQWQLSPQFHTQTSPSSPLLVLNLFPVRITCIHIIWDSQMILRVSDEDAVLTTDLWFHHVVFQPDLAEQCHVLSEVVFRDSVYSAEGQKLCRWWSKWRRIRD